MQTIEQYLPDLPFFAGMDPDQVALAAGCARHVPLVVGSYLFLEGGMADTFYLIRHGRVSVGLRTPTSSPLVDTASDGDIVGWSWLVPPYRWTFDALVTEPGVALAFDGACLREKCATDPALGYALLQRVVQVMSHRLHSARVRLLDLYGAPA